MQEIRIRAGGIMSLKIKLAYGELEKIKELFQEYSAALGIDLDFQDYEKELANLPDKYTFPHGRLYIATYNNVLAGCVALRPLNGNRSEAKRLYVRPPYRKLKIGNTLVEKIITDAKDIGYDNIVLDTLASMKPAIGLYKKLGFYEIEPYCYNPIKDAIFLQKDL